MFTPRVTAAVGAALGVIGLAVATAGGAAAGTVDAAFVTKIRGHGIGIDSPQAAVMDGYLVCVELNAHRDGGFRITGIPRPPLETRWGRGVPRIRGETDKAGIGAFPQPPRAGAGTRKDTR